jgi:hypothetical protein
LLDQQCCSQVKVTHARNAAAMIVQLAAKAIVKIAAAKNK